MSEVFDELKAPLGFLVVLIGLFALTFTKPAQDFGRWADEKLFGYVCDPVDFTDGADHKMVCFETNTGDHT